MLHIQHKTVGELIIVGKKSHIYRSKFGNVHFDKEAAGGAPCLLVVADAFKKGIDLIECIDV